MAKHKKKRSANSQSDAKEKQKAPLNQPFRGLVLPKKPEEPAPIAVQKQVSPTAQHASQSTASSELITNDADLFLRSVGGVERLPQHTRKRVEPQKREQSALPDDEALAQQEFLNFMAGDGDFRLNDSDE